MSDSIERSAAASPATQQAEHPVVDVGALGQQLMGRWADVRRASRVVAARPELKRVEGLSMEDHRARVLDQLHLLVKEGAVHKAFPKSVGGLEDAGGKK